MKTLFSILLILAAKGAPVLAATWAAAPIKQVIQPEPSFALRAPDHARWTVTYDLPKRDLESDEADAKKSSGRCIRWKVTKSGNTYHEDKTYEDGAQMESWRVGEMQIFLSADPLKIQIYEPSSFATTASGEILASPSVYTDFSRTDFPELKWVSRDMFVGILEKDDGGKFMVFRNLSPEGLPTSVTAYFDAKTLLPVRLETPAVVASYQFDSSRSAPLVLPEELRDFLQRRQKAIRTLTTVTPSY